MNENNDRISHFDSFGNQDNDEIMLQKTLQASLIDQKQVNPTDPI